MWIKYRHKWGHGYGAWEYAEVSSHENVLDFFEDERNRHTDRPVLLRRRNNYASVTI